MASSSANWSAIFRKGWQLAGQNIWAYLAYCAVQLGAWFVFSPTLTSFSFSLDTDMMGYGMGPTPSFDMSTSSVDAAYVFLGLFLSILGAAFALSAVRGRASLDEALRWNGERLWNMAWLCAIACGAAFLGLGAMVVIFGSGFAGSFLTAALAFGDPSDMMGSALGMVSAFLWPVLGGLALVVGLVTVLLGWAFAPYYVVDGVAPLAALQKSWAATHGHRWQLLFLHLVPMMVVWFCALLGLLLTALVAYAGVPLLTSLFSVALGAGVLGAGVLASGTTFFGAAALYAAVAKR
jgi:hypothetical protein